MDELPRMPDHNDLGELIAEAKRLLAKCDDCGLSLVAIDISSAIDKLEDRRRKLIQP
ncbi:MAG: hypothetical protein ACJLS3_00340 [Erythrobacter sp.]